MKPRGIAPLPLSWHHRSMHLRGILLSMAAMLAASAVFYAADGPKLPAPYATKASNNRPRVIPQPAGAQLTVPAGFKVEVWAEDFVTPRYMMLGPSNEILLTDSGTEPDHNGTIYVFQGKDRKKIIEKLNRPYGLAMLKGYLYVAECDSV